jgi:hypothetical protein
MGKSFLGLSLSDYWMFDVDDGLFENKAEQIEKLQVENVHLINKALKHYLQTNGVK